MAEFTTPAPRCSMNESRFHDQTSSENIEVYISAVPAPLPPPPSIAHFTNGQHHPTLFSLLYGEYGCMSSWEQIWTGGLCAIFKSSKSHKEGGREELASRNMSSTVLYIKKLASGMFPNYLSWELCAQETVSNTEVPF